jgi:hypothetical protein
VNSINKGKIKNKNIMKKFIEKQDAGDNTLSKQKLINEGYQEKKHFWCKRNRYGSVQISKNEKSDSATLTGDDQLAINKNIKKEEKEEKVGRITVLEHDRELLFDSNGKLKFLGGM